MTIRFLFLLPVLAGTAGAHHGRDFIFTLDAAAPQLWHGDVSGALSWQKSGGENEWSTENSVRLGLAPRVALGLGAGWSDHGDGWRYNGFAPSLHVDLTPPAWSRVRVALAVSYYFADREANPPASYRTERTVTYLPAQAAPVVTTNTPAPVEEEEEHVPCGPDLGPDAPPCPEPKRTPRHAGHAGPEPTTTTTKTASVTKGRRIVTTRRIKVPAPEPESERGLHRHHEDHIQSRLIVEADLTDADKLVLNLINVCSTEGGPTAWGYAAGYRHTLTHDTSLGLEALGEFIGENRHEAVLTGTWSPTHHLSLKLGLGTGLTDESPDLSVHTGLVWRF